MVHHRRGIAIGVSQHDAIGGNDGVAGGALGVEEIEKRLDAGWIGAIYQFTADSDRHALRPFHQIISQLVRIATAGIKSQHKRDEHQDDEERANERKRKSPPEG
jgi:hypothetical protein